MFLISGEEDFDPQLATQRLKEGVDRSVSFASDLLLGSLGANGRGDLCRGVLSAIGLDSKTDQLEWV